MIGSGWAVARKVELFGWTFAPSDKVMQIENTAARAGGAPNFFWPPVRRIGEARKAILFGDLSLLKTPSI